MVLQVQQFHCRRKRLCECLHAHGHLDRQVSIVFFQYRLNVFFAFRHSFNLLAGAVSILVGTTKRIEETSEQNT